MDLKIKFFHNFLSIMVDVILIRINPICKFVIDKALFNLSILNCFDATFFENRI